MTTRQAFIHTNRTDARPCPVCGAVLDATTAVSVDAGDPCPVLGDGDITCCAECRSVLVAIPAGFRLATEADLERLESTLRNLVAAFTTAAHFGSSRIAQNDGGSHAMKTLFTVTTPDGAPVDAALLEAVSPCGNWQAMTDDHGEFEADLGAGPYSVTATKDGITTDPVSTFVGPVPIVFQAGGGTVPPVTGGADAIDLAAAVITSGSPDVRAWPIGARLESLFLDFTANADVRFTKMEGPHAWPFVMGAEGEIQYTLWVGCEIGGLWYLCGAILCIKRPGFDNYVPTGPTLQPGQLPKNWYYYAGAPLATYQPQPGERVAWFLTAGVQRRDDIHAIAERTQVVIAPFSPGTWTFDGDRVRHV